MSNIIMPGDPEFSQAPEVGKLQEPPALPNQLLEAAFTEVVQDAQAAVQVAEEGSEVHGPTTPSEPPFQSKSWYRKNAVPGYKMHGPARQRSFTHNFPEARKATLKEDLPRSWEKTCYRKFKAGDEITITGTTFYPGIGALYAFTEGMRGSYGLREDQILFLEEVVALEESSEPVVDILSSPIVEVDTSNTGE
jgi:hypothetical protein